MKKQLFTLLLSGFIFCGLNSSAQKNDCLKKFSWLNGTWRMQEKESVTVEEWTDEALTSMECKSYEVKGKDTVMIETATINCISGKHVFTYHPILKDKNDTRQPVSFVLISEENNTFVFENKAHDFPQRVVYQNVNANECHAWIEGEENGKKNKIDFYYKRTK